MLFAYKAYDTRPPEVWTRETGLTSHALLDAGG
jgi:hypothetical protein